MKIMTNTYFSAIIIAIMSMIVFSCSSDEPEIKGRTERQEINLDVQSRSISDKISDFHIKFTSDAVKYFDKIGPSTNVIVSPLSASIALGIFANGVDDLTAQQIYTYLGTSDLEALNKLHSSLMSELPIADEKAEMTLDNSIWYSKNYKINNTFKSIADKYYKSEIQSVDFSNTIEAKNKLDDWIERHTNGLIRNFNETIKQETIFAIINAIYFKDVWGREYFTKDNVETKTFHGLNGDTQVEFLVTNKQYEFTRRGDFLAFRLPFGNGAFSLLIVCPEGGDPTQTITPEDVNSLINNFMSKKDTLMIPKFNVTSKFEITDIFSNSGVDRLSQPTIKMFDDDVSDYSVNVTQGCSSMLPCKRIGNFNTIFNI
ncbi:MAG: hypothetical protein NC453_10165, partial [Muribaculum sp.]|nr:hypothetical protein [Muribaculum sp.]